MRFCSAVAVNRRGAKTSLPIVSDVYQPISAAGVVDAPWGRARAASGLKEPCVYTVSRRSYP